MTTDHESALIGILLSPDNEPTFDAVEAAGLTTDDFTNPLGRLFGAIMDLRRQGKPVNLVTASDLLLPETLDAAGGQVGLNRLVDAAPIVAHAGYHARQIIEAAAKRRIATLADTWAHAARNGEAPAELLQKIGADAEHEVDRLSGHDDEKPLSLVELADQEQDPGEVLIGTRSCRYLERGAVLMLVAPAGVGKSHIGEQTAVSWSCGRPAFGLPATMPLRCFVAQAENPPNDARAMAAAAIGGLDLNDDERRLVEANTRQVWLPGITGDKFLARLRAYLRAWPADVVFLDPLSAFADGDLSKPETSQRFCRAGLGRLAVDHNAALFVCHHVPKPNQQRDAARTGAYDWQYAGSGSADLVANWPRAVLTLQALARGEFLMRAAKRRPPWAAPDGVQRWEIGMRHTPFHVWESFDVSPGMVTGAGRPKAPPLEDYKADALKVAGKVCPCPKSILADALWHDVTGARNRARALVDHLTASGALVCRLGQGKGSPYQVGLPEHFKAQEVA